MNDNSKISCRRCAACDAQRSSRQADRLRHLARGPSWLACAALSTEDTATVKVIGGTVYTAHQIDRFRYGPKPA